MRVIVLSVLVIGFAIGERTGTYMQMKHDYATVKNIMDYCHLPKPKE